MNVFYGGAPWHSAGNPPNMYLYGPGWLSWLDSPSDNKMLTLGDIINDTN